MMVGFSKRLKRAGGFGILAGVRVTRRNAWYMIVAVFFLFIVWLMWKMMLLAGWGLYGFMWLFAQIFKKPYEWYKAAKPKSKAVFWYVVAGIFAVGSVPSFVEAEPIIGVVTLLIAAGIGFWGFRISKADDAPRSNDEQ